MDFEMNQPINPLFNSTTVRSEQINLLMEKLKKLHEKTKQKLPKTILRKPCDHLHVECWDGIFMCSRCHQPVTDLDRIQHENEMANLLGEKDLSVPEDSVIRGVTISFLVAFCQTFNLYVVTTGEVLRNYVVPFTSASRCRFVELEAMQESDVVGESKTFISHCLNAPFGALVAALCDGGADLTRRVWIDIFAVRQWPSSKHDLNFEKVIKQCPSFMLVYSPLEKSDMSYEDIRNRRIPAAAMDQLPFFRIWCLYELNYAAIEGKSIAIKGGSCELEEGPEGKLVIYFKADDGTMLGNVYLAIDVSDAKATLASDKAMIVERILSYEEGVSGFNNRVREFSLGQRKPVHTLNCSALYAETPLRWPLFESSQRNSSTLQRRLDCEPC